MKCKADKRVLIIEKAIELMHLKGYNATGVQEITDAAGVPKGSFYTYFKDKETLAGEAIDYYLANSKCMVSALCSDPSSSSVEKIIKFYSDARDGFVEDGTYSRGCFISNIAEEMADTSGLISSAAERAFNIYVSALENCISEGIKKGEISDTIDARATAEFLQNSWIGTLLRMKACKCRKPLDQFVGMAEYILKK